MTLFATLRLPREILFGKGQRHILPDVARRHGRRVLVVTDERFAATPTFAEIRDGLEAVGLAVMVHDRVLPDVPRDTVAACVAEVGDFKPDMVIGIGGGSCLDMAKCAALLISHGGALSDYYGEFKVPGPVLPVIAVPTSVGYGAAFGGVAALLGMLNSCASGVTVVNIDNGFGAALAAGRVNLLGGPVGSQGPPGSL